MAGGMRNEGGGFTAPVILIDRPDELNALGKSGQALDCAEFSPRTRRPSPAALASRYHGVC